MSIEEIRRFNTDVKSNSSMQEDIKPIGNDMDKIISYANEKGYNFSAADIKASPSGLSDEDLDGVAGGGGATAVALIEAIEVVGVVAVVSG